VETRDKIIFIFVAFSTVILVVVNIFVGMTIYTQGDTLLHSTGSAQDISTGMGYMLYMFGVMMLNNLILLLSVFLIHYKLWHLQKDSEEYDELDI
jgi:hypothetical protein